MPSEVRHIFFEEAELRRALVKYALVKGKTLLFDDIKSIIINNSGMVSATLMIKKIINEPPIRMEFSTAELAAALVLFCKETGVPLPKKGVKSLNVDEDRVYMTIILDERLKIEGLGLDRLTKKFVNKQPVIRRNANPEK
ncbi:hypothetical protein [Luteithermobacter gelatinilyticus]|uniref:hypothetical protein n=1 Tax=Luteithermobacter gelatinilyticus TaxID=2582913 RepID=UPI001106187A|nr:hypothetical protein [Luteithermobacter gelatinilyticus]